MSDMAIFAMVVQSKNITQAARKIRLTPSAVTKRLNRLEERFGLKLLNRTTRKISLTEAGSKYYERSKQILRDIEWLDSSIAIYSDNPRGMLKVTAPSLFGRIQISPLVLKFRKLYPDIQVHLQLTDRNIDIVGEGVDISIQNTDLADSSLMLKRLVTDRQVICGAPDYFAKNGYPEKPEDLLEHDCLLLRFPGSKQYRWHFIENKKNTSYLVKGPIDTNSTELLHQWALEGVGLSLCSTFEIEKDIQNGNLVPVLTNFERTHHAYYALYPKRELMPKKTHVFLDFLTERINQSLLT